MEEKKAVGVTRQWFRHRVKGIAAGGAYDEIEYRHSLEAFYLQITRISLEEKGTASSSIRLYVKGHGYEHWIGEEKTVVVDTLYWIEWPTYLVEGETLVARFIGATEDNVLEMLVEGWAYDPPTILTNIVVTVGGVPVE